MLSHIQIPNGMKPAAKDSGFVLSLEMILKCTYHFWDFIIFGGQPKMIQHGSFMSENVWKWIIQNDPKKSWGYLQNVGKYHGWFWGYPPWLRTAPHTSTSSPAGDGPGRFEVSSLEPAWYPFPQKNRWTPLNSLLCRWGFPWIYLFFFSFMYWIVIVYNPSFRSDWIPKDWNRGGKCRGSVYISGSHEIALVCSQDGMMLPV